MKFIKVPNDIDNKLNDAIAYFWTTRSGQIERQQNHGVIDNGNRGAVTGGKQLDGFVDLISDLLKLNGVPSECIFTKSDLEIPGFYRPNKKWDLLVVDNMKLIVAIEFKSQVGPSFGNNLIIEQKKQWEVRWIYGLHIEKEYLVKQLLHG